MERHIMTWQREHPHDGLHPLFDDILRRQLFNPRHEPKPGHPQPPAKKSPAIPDCPLTED